MLSKELAQLSSLLFLCQLFLSLFLSFATLLVGCYGKIRRAPPGAVEFLVSAFQVGSRQIPAFLIRLH